MTVIKNNDFVEVEYTGRLKDLNKVFDTTSREEAEKEGILNEKSEYKPVVVCIGEKQIVKGIDQFLIGKETGKEYVIELGPQDAFGKKSASLIQIIPAKKFLEQNINPIAGLQVNIDGVIGTIKNVSGGRTLVDFNHPLSGREVVYKIKVNMIVEDEKKKIQSFLANVLGINENEFKIEFDGGKATLELKEETPKQFEEELSKKLKEIIPSLKELLFTYSNKKK